MERFFANLFDLSDSDSEDVELQRREEYLEGELALLAVKICNVPKVVNFVENVVMEYSDKQFRSHFRMSRKTVDSLVAIYKDSPYGLQKNSYPGRPKIAQLNEMLIFLWFVGNEGSMRQVWNLFGVSKGAACRILTKMLNFFEDIAPSFISFPDTTMEKDNMVEKFSKVAGFPGVIGCIESTYIPIATPAKKIKATYVNQHDDTSITLQAICDVEKKFVDIFTGAPSKIHHARVFEMSPVSDKLQGICEGRKYHILGDSAYSCREWLLTPYKAFRELSNEQLLYNAKFFSTHAIVKNASGILKARFRQLHRIRMHSVDNIRKVILACCALHNFCIMEKDEHFESAESFQVNEEGEEEIGENERKALLTRLGQIKKDEIARFISSAYKQ